jgi:hypothetical protein
MIKLWDVIFEDEFDLEFHAMSEGLQNELLAHALLLRDYGPTLGRPTVDSLKGSKHSNMKELRFNFLNGVWRIAFAFDPKRHAVLLAAVDKAGIHKQRAYKKLIETADKRFDTYLNIFENEKRRK